MLNGLNAKKQLTVTDTTLCYLSPKRHGLQLSSCRSSLRRKCVSDIIELQEVKRSGEHVPEVSQS